MSLSPSDNTLPPLEDGRTRYVGSQWVRDPSGPLITKPPPRGIRTPNGLIWGHDLRDFMWIQRVPNVDVYTIWSRSMIKEFGENYDEKVWEQQDRRQRPRRLFPWPVLKLPKEIADLGLTGLSLGVIDEGCEKHCEPGHVLNIRQYDALADETHNSAPESGTPELDALIQCILPGIKDDAGLLVLNNPHKPVLSSHGIPYTLLWAPHVRQSLEIARYPLPSGMPPANLVFDPSGFTQGPVLGHVQDVTPGSIIIDEVGVVQVSVATSFTHTPEVYELDVLDTEVSDNGEQGTSFVLSQEIKKTPSIEPREPSISQDVSSKTVSGAASPVDVSSEGQDTAEKQVAASVWGDDTNNLRVDKLANSDKPSNVAIVITPGTVEETDSSSTMGAAAFVDGDGSSRIMGNVIIHDVGTVMDGSNASPDNVYGALIEDTGAKDRATSNSVGQPTGDNETPHTEATSNGNGAKNTDEDKVISALPSLFPEQVSNPKGKKQHIQSCNLADVEPGEVKDSGSRPKDEEQEASISRYEKPPHDSPYSTKRIPKLEEFIPTAFLPDVLMVHDPHDVTLAPDPGYSYGHHNGKGKTIKKYIRLFPKPLDTDSNQESRSTGKPPRVAHLYLHQQNKLGSGHHSLVYRAPLSLPAPLSAHSRNGNVVVAAKTAYSRSGARNLLGNEGLIYSGFPQHLMEDWCGYNLVPPLKHPVPVGPVVPKFFGSYAPEDGGSDAETDMSLPSPILLVEECGVDVDPDDFTLDERSECYSLMLRLHHAHFIQNSFYVRNIMVQPGPLTVPPQKRSRETPSFRIIDFGRARHFSTWLGNGSDQKRVDEKSQEWWRRVDEEDQQAQESLAIPSYTF